MKKKVVKYSLLALLIILAAFSQTLSMKADIGVCACWDSVSMNVYQITGIKVGTFSIVGNLASVAIQLLILKKEFPPVKFLQIPVAILFGIVTNAVYYHVLVFEIHSYFVRMLLWALSYIGLALFIGALTIMDIITMPVEGTCYIISSRYGIDFAKLRLSADAACIIISLALTFAFGLTLKIREGTIAGMLVLGPLMGWCMKWEKKVLEHIDL